MHDGDERGRVAQRTKDVRVKDRLVLNFLSKKNLQAGDVLDHPDNALPSDFSVSVY